MPQDNSDLLTHARQLRRDMTQEERKLWYLFLRRYPVKFYKQKIVGPYIVDFFCHPARLVLELDGSQHYSDEGQSYDKRRSAFLEQQGLLVLRFSNREINQEFAAVCQKIDDTVKQRIGGGEG